MTTLEKDWVTREADTGREILALMRGEEEKRTPPLLFPGLPPEAKSGNSGTTLVLEDIDVVETLPAIRMARHAGQYSVSAGQYHIYVDVTSDVTDIASHLVTNVGSFGVYTPVASAFTLPWGVETQLVAAKAKFEEQEATREALIRREMNNLFSVGANEVFQDGEESEFSSGFVALVSKEGIRAISVLQSILANERTSATVASEALRWLTEVEDEETYNARRVLLERCLRARSSKVRDGALTGLASMNDRRSIAALREAIDAEHIRLLRGCMSRVLRQLESEGR